MQRDDFAKLRLDFFVNFEPCYYFEVLPRSRGVLSHILQVDKSVYKGYQWRIWSKQKQLYLE